MTGPILAVGLVIAAAVGDLCAGETLKVGIFTGSGSVATGEVARLLKEEGMEAYLFSPKDLSKGNIYAYDVLYFGGGWKESNWTDLAGRMHIVEYARARGCGVIFSSFRCGCSARTSIRTIFPEIGEGKNKCNTTEMIVTDKTHPITQGLPERFMHPFWDHTVMKVGPDGKVLAVDGGENVTLLCGETGKGRAVYIGSFLGLDWQGEPVYPLDVNDRKLRHGSKHAVFG